MTLYEYNTEKKKLDGCVNVEKENKEICNHKCSALNITNIRENKFWKKAKKDISISRKETTFNILFILENLIPYPLFKKT